MRGWAWAAVALLWPQLSLPGGVSAWREPKRPRPPGPRTEPLNAIIPSSDEPPGAPRPPEASGPEFTDAHTTWLSFVRRPDDGAARKRCRGRDKQSVRVGSRARLSARLGGAGPCVFSRPACPPARALWTPRAPRAPGAEIPREALLREFRELLREATEHRLPGPPGGRPLAEAFHCRLREPVWVDRRTLVELRGFQSPMAEGNFLRGVGLSLASGRFTAPTAAVFQFSASLLVDHSELKGRARPRVQDAIRVLICIVSLCHRHTSLEAIAGLDSSGRAFTVLVQGLLQLQAGQYVSVFVDNGSRAPLTV